MTKKLKIGLAFGVLTLVSFVALWDVTRNTASKQEAGRSAIPVVYRFVKGQRDVYSLKLNTSLRIAEQSTGAALGPSQLVTDIDVNVDVESVSENDTVLAISVADIRQFDWQIFSQQAVNTAQASDHLHGRLARAHVDESGYVTQVAYTKDPSPVFATLMQTFLFETTAVLQGVQEYARHEKSPVATLRARYRWKDTPNSQEGILSKEFIDASDMPAQMNQKVAAAAVHGQMTFELRNGRIYNAQGNRSMELSNSQHVSIIDTYVSVDLKHITTQKAPEHLQPSDGLVMKLNDVLNEGDTPEQRLQQRIAGMTPEEVYIGLRHIAADVRAPDRQQWFWRASGLVRYDPNVGKAIVDAFRNSQASQAQENLAADLLVAANTSASQENLRELLDIVQSRDAARAANLIAHAALIQNPDPAMVAYVADQYAQSNGAMHHSAMLTLGALGRQLYVSGQVGEAGSVVRDLATGLRNATDQRETALAIRALGNTALPEATPILLPYAQDERPMVRQSVAAALRHGQNETTENILLKLAIDKNAFVQREALTSLVDYHPTPRQLQELIVQIRKGEFKPNSHETLLNLLTKWEAAYPQAVEQALVALIAQPQHLGSDNSRARSLLAQVRHDFLRQ